eukprot:TRINITY_DN21294_c0_g1_i1.p1 TRINITY_DN21294_c0_g1~~TRINITY_DN21294_c0_g1_i1.p1  ORF type:complete len:293 (-),score=35.66 TRINITY_DN21294_c0_g1_i1:95-973(-)
MDHDPHKHANRLLEAMVPIAQLMITLFIGGIGMMLGCTVGSLVYPNPPAVGAVIGGSIATVLFAVIGCCLTGFWRSLVPDIPLYDSLFSILPQAVAVHSGGHSNFTCVVTIHELEHVYVTNRYLTSPRLYVEVECSGNPMKSTCVRTDGKFNEQFRLAISPGVKVIMFRIMDQQLMGADEVGFTTMNIKDIVNLTDGFPYKKPLPIQGDDEYTLRHVGGEKPALIASFDATADYDPHLVAIYTDREEQTRLWSTPQYGSVDYLAKLQFNTDVRLDMGHGLPHTQRQGSPPLP